MAQKKKQMATAEPAEPKLRGTPAPMSRSNPSLIPGGGTSRLQPEGADPELEHKIQEPTKVAEDVSRQMQRLLDSMTTEDALRIKAELGIIIPIRLTTEDKSRNFAYKCNLCQGRALEFVGEKFLFMRDGVVYESDTPPIGVPIEEIPFVQEREDFTPPTNPLNIICMHCHQPIQLNADHSLRPMQIQQLSKNDQGPESRRHLGHGVRKVTNAAR